MVIRFNPHFALSGWPARLRAQCPPHGEQYLFVFDRAGQLHQVVDLSDFA
jgi:hypothetical protein